MEINFNPPQTYRAYFTFSNGAIAIARFPDPFPSDDYRYSVNLEPHLPGPAGTVFEKCFDIDEHYHSEILERARVLDADSGRSQVLPHMFQAEWDALELIATSLARDYPTHFLFERAGDDCLWTNRILKTQTHFTFGARGEFGPRAPLEFIARQMQGDFVLLDHRDGTLYLDGAVLTSQADWSLAFDLGMNFLEWHRPVPVDPGDRLFERALGYVTRIRVGQPVRRLNWSLTVHPRLDTSTETFDRWGGDRRNVRENNIGTDLHLRVELQTLFRLPLSNAILFSIRTYLIRLEDFVSVPGRRERMYRALRSMPDAVIDYKGMRMYFPTLMKYLTPTGPS